MKRILIAILLSGLVLSLSACAKKQDTSASALAAAPSPAQEAPLPEKPDAASEEVPAGQNSAVTEADIYRMYSTIRENGWDYLGCVLTPDRANGCVGAALYWDGEETTNVCFFDETGFSYRAGPVAKTAEDPAFTYLGDGAVSMKLQNEDGTVYDYTLTLDLQNGPASVNWTATDSLSESCATPPQDACGGVFDGLSRFPHAWWDRPASTWQIYNRGRKEAMSPPR